MGQINWIEIMGYAASIFVAVSLMMESILKLRIINFIGSMLFGIYGLLIDSIPVMLVNYFIALTNVYYLWKLFKNNQKQS
jgi:hypothetical protein